MCLKVRKNAKKQTAKTDIIVYKRVNSVIILDRDKIKDGDEFTGIIKGVICSGKIHKDKVGKIWFCTDNENLNGDYSPKRFGFKYSWSLDNNVTSVIINNEDVSKLFKYCTPYKIFFIEIGETYTSSLIKDEDDNVNYGLHSFESLEDAKKDGHGVYVRCVIPKGSQYYIGKFGYSISYASDTLKYIEIVE